MSSTNESEVQELQNARARVAELEAAMDAVYRGEVDAIAVNGPEGRRVFPLQHPDDPYRVLAEGMSEGAATLDADGTILFCNHRMAEMAGRPAARLMGLPFALMMREQERAAFPELLQCALKQSCNVEAESFLLNENGNQIPTRLSISSVPMGQGAVGICLVATDLSERTRAKEQRERLAAIVDSSFDAIVSKDLNGIINAWNRGAESVFGYSASEAVGKPMLMLFPSNRVSEEAEILARIRRGESLEHFETTRIRKDGKLIDVSVTISPIRDGRGVVVGASKVARDITERKRAEATLAAQAAELARSNAELEQFAYVASHDLQEPLRMVAAYTQLLAERYRGKLDADADKFIGYASEGAQRMQVLIRDLLAFSRVGRTGSTRREIDCNTVLKEVLQTLAPAIAESGAVINPNDLPVIWGDRTQVAQVFQNLIGNAIKFRQKEAPAISIRAEKSEHDWRFLVTDNGIGIPPGQAENIFIAFQRLHARTEYPGNGIGLAICKKIIEHYGGKIWVESNPGSGSTFIFTLPFVRADTLEALIDEN